MLADRRKSLAIITSLSAARDARGRYRLTRKFLEGMQVYADSWDGEVCAYFHPGSLDGGNLDLVDVADGDVDFGICVSPFDKPEFYRELDSRGIVLGMHYLLPDLAQRCLELGVPCVYNPEYTLRTRLQIIRSEREGVLRQLRGAVWELREEARVAQQIRIADGVQCNGLPTFEKYSKQNRAPLLYFDSRIRDQALISQEELTSSNRRRLLRQPLHLVFSGRLIRSKGADQLVSVARALRARGVAFRMSICGDGEIKPLIGQQIQQAGLGDSVQLNGVLDFSRELLPFLKQSADLFVCCHRQGDPSCTYLETFACGVPIVGYANEALATLTPEARAGQHVRSNRPEELAELISELDDNREQLCSWATHARAFAAKHSMERTFARRVSHLLGIRNAVAEGRPRLDGGASARSRRGAASLIG
jgi:colanic acid/amylovoran biosynthesis glycosyltransferase